jgi:hypothetical protein
MIVLTFTGLFLHGLQLPRVWVRDRALRDGHFDFARDWDGMNLKTADLGQDPSGWDVLWIVLGFFGIFGITKYCFLHLILRLYPL